MEKEICTIEIGRGVLDNGYTIYKSGKIKHCYDQSIYKPNQEAWYDADKIEDNIKKKLMDKCPVEFQEQVRGIRYSGSPN